jgi:hypothetical protein
VWPSAGAAAEAEAAAAALPLSKGVVKAAESGQYLRWYRRELEYSWDMLIENLTDPCESFGVVGTLIVVGGRREGSGVGGGGGPGASQVTLGTCWSTGRGGGSQAQLASWGRGTDCSAVMGMGASDLQGRRGWRALLLGFAPKGTTYCGCSLGWVGNATVVVADMNTRQ